MNIEIPGDDGDQKDGTLSAPDSHYNSPDSVEAGCLLKLMTAVTACLAEGQDIATAVEKSLRLICESRHWSVGRYWCLDEKAVYLFAVWPAEIDGEKSDVGIPGLAIGGDERLIRQVWQSRKPLWVSNTASLHPEATLEASYSELLYPVNVTDRVEGVIEFSAVHMEEPSAALWQAVDIFARQLASAFRFSKTAEELRESKEHFYCLTQITSDFYWEKDSEDRFTRFEGFKSDAAINFVGKRSRELGFEVEGGWDYFDEVHQSGKPFRDLIMSYERKGKRYYVSISGEPVLDAEGRLSGYRGVSRDITALKQAEEYVRYMATHDSLTGLPNRTLFSQLLNMTISTSMRYNRKFAVFFIDLDRFKLVNDTLGHEAGDDLLKQVSAHIQGSIRTSDVLARLGGDEFAVLIQEIAGKEQAAAVAKNILSAALKPVKLKGQDYRLTASIGICLFPQEAQDEETLLKNADMAMYLAKEQGKNNYQFYSNEINSRTFGKMAMERNLRDALDLGQFSLHYQAKVDMKSRTIKGVEALLRWSSPQLGSVPPAQFIPCAEETGLIIPIGNWVLNTACAQNVAWQKQGFPPIRMSVNLSPRQFSDPDLIQKVVDALEASGMSPSLLELEVTEGVMMLDPDQARKTLIAIKELGVRVAVDDFGTGYSSLAHLQRFPLDTLKVDRCFIRGVPGDAEGKAITEAIIAMGKTLGLTIVAEGVETEEQLQFLASQPCDEIQGFYFSKPVDPDEFQNVFQQFGVAAPD